MKKLLIILTVMFCIVCSAYADNKAVYCGGEYLGNVQPLMDILKYPTLRVVHL
jgi:uncharacterized protein YxeA